MTGVHEARAMGESERAATALAVRAACGARPLGSRVMAYQSDPPVRAVPGPWLVVARAWWAVDGP